MSTITYSSAAVELKSDEEMLKIWQDAQVALQAGQEYTIVGSRTFKAVDSTLIQDQISFYERRIFAKKGHIGRNTADFSRG